LKLPTTDTAPSGSSAGSAKVTRTVPSRPGLDVLINFFLRSGAQLRYTHSIMPRSRAQIRDLTYWQPSVSRPVSPGPPVRGLYATAPHRGGFRRMREPLARRVSSLLPHQSQSRGGLGRCGVSGRPWWAFQNKVCLRRVRGPRCGLVAPCGSGRPAAMRCAAFAASCPRGCRVDGAIVLVLCGPTAHRPASGGRDPMRKTADLAYNGRNSPARRELKLSRDVYPVAPILRTSPILHALMGSLRRMGQWGTTSTRAA
jgi:hypothetical protein